MDSGHVIERHSETRRHEKIAKTIISLLQLRDLIKYEKFVSEGKVEG